MEKITRYDLYRLNDNNFIARFTDKNEAIKTKNWLNEDLFKKEYCNIKIVKITEKNSEDFLQKNIKGLTFNTLSNFIEYLSKSNASDNVFYEKKTSKTCFVKYENNWYRFDEKTPLNKAIIYNAVGGRRTDVDLTNFEIVEKQDWPNLDWKGTDLYNNDKFETGWLSPSGEFFGCEYHSHISQANLVHNCSERDLESAGWIKITYGRNPQLILKALLGYDKNYNQVLPTPQQIRYLKNSNIQNWDMINHFIRITRQNNILQNEK